MKAGVFFAITLAGSIVTTQGKPLVVHEWGTFTSLQDEAGRTISGINTDDEPVPSFCHDLDRLLIGKIGMEGKAPETKERVWTAPRAVDAAPVTTSSGESEKFLFYRGVGHVPCPLQIKRSADSKTLECRA